jgi:hypothetical protein
MYSRSLSSLPNVAAGYVHEEARAAACGEDGWKICEDEHLLK